MPAACDAERVQAPSSKPPLELPFKKATHAPSTRLLCTSYKEGHRTMNTMYI